MHETYFVGGEFLRDIVIGIPDGLTVPSLWLQDSRWFPDG